MTQSPARSFAWLFSRTFLAALLSAIFAAATFGQNDLIKPANILFYGRYTSDPANPQTNNTQVNITNVSKTASVNVHLFMVENGSGQVADSFLTLTPAQTTSFLASDFDPGIQGKIYAAVINPQTWEPVPSNNLIGSFYVREANGASYNQQAVPLAALPSGVTDGFSTPAEELQQAKAPAVVEQFGCVNCPSKPGSVLFFTRYTSNAANPKLSDTHISISGGSLRNPVTIHLFLVDGSSCSVADLYIQNGGSFLMSEMDPGIEGYIVAVAVDENGAPTQSNTLSGSASIREEDGRAATLPALPFQKLSPGSAVATDGVANLNFNGVDYERLPNSLAVASFNSQQTDASYLTVFSPARNLGIGSTESVSIFALLYDDAEVSLSSGFNFRCYHNDSFVRLFNRNGGINRHVPAGRTGWVSLNSGRPILGSVISQGPIFNGGHNLHALGFAADYSVSIPLY
jgi:hypothetical protein